MLKMSSFYTLTVESFHILLHNTYIFSDMAMCLCLLYAVILAVSATLPSVWCFRPQPGRAQQLCAQGSSVGTSWWWSVHLIESSSVDGAVHCSVRDLNAETLHRSVLTNAVNSFYFFTAYKQQMAHKLSGPQTKMTIVSELVFGWNNSISLPQPFSLFHFLKDVVTAALTLFHKGFSWQWHLYS